MNFTKAIVRTPCPRLEEGLSSAQLGKVIFEKALQQHQAYCDALKSCGLEIIQLEADNRFPDSVFVEDVALITKHFAILCNPGAPSRNGEKELIREELLTIFPKLDTIEPPGTLEGGDVMMAGDHFYIGLSKRTNSDGANQLIKLVLKHGKRASIVPLNGLLHLKTGTSYLENNNLLVHEAFSGQPQFSLFNQIPVPKEEAYAANSLWINGTVLIPAGHPHTCQKILALGYPVIELDLSEFQKLDGGLSCLSLRF